MIITRTAIRQPIIIGVFSVVSEEQFAPKANKHHDYANRHMQYNVSVTLQYLSYQIGLVSNITIARMHFIHEADW